MSENVSNQQDQDRFRQHLENASATVRDWPEWKQKLLGWTSAKTWYEHVETNEVEQPDTDDRIAESR